ncbi:hypothetical protein LTR41_007999 [Exophiala xenobiotica]|nr:hypothetical protein LTR41_007999 [Exophiala xenobiotica]
MPLQQQGPWAKQIAEKYGEIRTVNDLLERRAAIYCSRPPAPMTQGIMSGGSRIVLMPYSERWRTVRRIMHQILSQRQENLYKPYQDLESKQLLWDYLKNTTLWYTANGRYANSVIMNVVFGTRTDLTDPNVEELFETAELFMANQQPGVNIVDGFPILDKLPRALQWWRPRGERIFKKTIAVYKRAISAMEDRKARGLQKPCFAEDYMEISRKEDFDETQHIFVLGTLMEAGSDTSRVTLNQIIAGAATYPDWVIRARKQLDKVCGDAKRLPGWDDHDRLPYITAVVKEGFRWRPNIAEIGAPTMLIRDDEYEGYKFPAGTIFTWNAWAISLSENEYEQPERFWPERFLNKDLNNPLKGHWAFGPGRRVCAGWKVGEMNVWIAIARLLYCFDFEQDPAHPIDTMTIPQFTSGKKPYDVKIKVRSPEHAALIERDCWEASNTKY